MTSREFHFLNLGAGVQSTALYLMSMDGDEPEVPKFDVAIFSDTQEEPDEVYRHLEWLEQQGGPPICRTTAGKLGDALDAGSDAAGNKRTDGGHYISIPAFTSTRRPGSWGRSSGNARRISRLSRLSSGFAVMPAPLRGGPCRRKR